MQPAGCQLDMPGLDVSTVSAWNKDKEEEAREEKKTFNSKYEIIVDYSEYSTIQGLIYVFFSYQTLFGRIFWIITIFLMTILGLYWCIQSYVDWQNQPVLTTITTTAYNIRAVRKCSFHHIC
jgi:hypothetical protein